ncbi:hypothetical protein Gocc_2588 [Gaiella occulta]|uniref:Uncharacterized protein n=1 Tax=Gaiella occulta TaxID=1002870 RepID=A0A7M2YUJ8_9ACTN|nr:hypothetical protein [Gaiella occulta]RDI73675.1 hypothetical protein Gocc_2588 [Gaiella occulta]
MSKQTLVVIVGAIVLFAVGIIGALSFTGASTSGGHQMPNGQTMTGEMTGQTGGTGTMQAGQTMPGMDMTP